MFNFLWFLRTKTKQLGKSAATPELVKFVYEKYFDTTELPQAPAAFSHADKVSSWGMLGNDDYGDCVWAGADHEHRQWNASAGRVVRFSRATALSDYAAATGFNPKDPNTDNGTNVSKAASYRRKIGVIDRKGTRHKVAAYVRLNAGDVDKTKQAVYLFGAVGIGINFPSSAMDQFNARLPWSVVRGSQIEGGHYVPIIGYDANYFYVVTWGKVQKMTYDFFRTYNDESIVYLTDEDMISGKTLEGFNLSQLQADLRAL